MGDQMNQSVSKALTLFDVLITDGYQGKPLVDIAIAANVNPTTAWRLMKTLEAYGWVVEVPVAGSKQPQWRVATRLASVAHAYQRNALDRVQAVRREYRDVTGEELVHG